MAQILTVRYAGTVARSKEITLLLGVLLIGAFFRLYLITEIPPGLYPDEAANGNNAVEALRSGEFKIFYPENNGREGLFINLQALAIRFFGPEPWALRIVSAVFGTLTVLGIYLLAKELFQRSGSGIMNHESRNAGNHDSKFKIQDSTLIALLSSFFIAVSFWHINFSRIGFRAIMLPFLATFGMYWLLKSLRTGKISSALAGGIAAGLGFSTYIGFRFMPFVLAVPMLVSLRAWLRRRRVQFVSIGQSTDTAAGPCAPCVIALFLFAALVAALPLGMYFLQHPTDFFGRSAQVSIFSAGSPAWEFLKSNALTLGMLNIRGDCNPRHNLNCAPQLFWPVGILFAVGLILTVRNAFAGAHKSQTPNHKQFGIWNLKFGISRSTSWTLLAWFLFMMLPATLTKEGLPHALRAIGMIPPVMIFAGIGGVALWTALRGYFDRALANRAYAAYRSQLARVKKELVIAAALFLVWLPVNAYRDYFIRFAYAPQTQSAFAVDLWEAGQRLRDLPADAQKFVIVNIPGEDIRGVPAPAQTVMFASDTFGEEERRLRKVTYVRRIEDIRIDPVSGGIDSGVKVAIMPLNSKDGDLIAAIKKRFPGLRTRNRGGIVVFEN